VKSKRNPKVMAAVLITGTVVLVAGGVLTASWPAGHKATSAVAVAAQSAPRSSSGSTRSTSTATTPPASGGVDADSTTQPAPATTINPPTPAPTNPPSFTYTVQPGDTLFDIAQWFKLHGYGDLYSANAAVIGTNPSLIRPGERITVTGGVWTMQPPA
jgi:LysM repeat protein